MNSKDKKLVSIIMPVFNAADYLVEAVESIRTQTYKNWELIAVDDASTDNSFNLLQRLAKKDKRIKIYQNKKNLGVAATANIALAKTKGKYIARMDADDIAFADRLSKQVKYLCSNQDVVAVGGQCVLINAEGKKVGEKHFPTEFSDIKKMMFSSIPVQQPTIMINTSLLPKRFSWYDGNFTVAEEVELIFKFFNYGKVCNLKDKVLKYRIHARNTSLVNPKKTFYSTLKTRIKGVYKYSYRPSIKGVAVTMAELIVVTILPSSTIYPVYSMLRGLNEKRRSIALKPQLAKLGL